MKKQSYEIKHYVNDNIKIGDLVKIVDGSRLTIDSHVYNLKTIDSYPDLFNTKKRIESIIFKVVQTNVNTNVYIHHFARVVYMQDIVIEYNGVQLRTCSKFVKLINNV